MRQLWEEEVIAQVRRRTQALSVAALCLAAAAGARSEEPGGPDTGFFLWTDTSATLLPYGTGFEVDPGEQSTLTLEHAHASKIGDLFMFVDFTHFQTRTRRPATVRRGMAKSARD